LELQNRSNIQIYLTQLQTLMNAGNPVTIAVNDLSKLDIALNLSDTSAFASNPSLNYFRQQIEIAEKLTSVDKSKILPDISIGYFNQTLISTPLNDANTSFANSSNRFQGVQVGLSIPLWFVPQTAKVNASRMNEQIAKSNFEAEQKSLNGQYQQILQEYSASSKQTNCGAIAESL
jgi:cobalt-zinc-cadmium resistance protein CzcA